MSNGNFQLVIGDMRYSSWSMRPWLVMHRFEIPFQEIKIKLGRPESRESLLRHSPSAKVPVLLVGDVAIWDSLAIAEYLHESFPERGLWPEEKSKRAIARVLSAEMHSSFQALREHCPMDVLSRKQMRTPIESVHADVERITQMWMSCRAQYGGGGSYLFGDFSIADAMYTPVATRFKTYGISLSDFGDDGTAATYMETLLNAQEFLRWVEEAKSEEDANNGTQ